MAQRLLRFPAEEVFLGSSPSPRLIDSHPVGFLCEDDPILVGPRVPVRAFIFRNVFKVHIVLPYMLEGLISLAWAGVYSGGAFGDLLYQWEQMGMFAYILPFLLIFAIVYGILNRTKIFDAQGVNVIIAIVVGLMALQFQMVSVFFAEIFPRLGVGLSVILVILILVGMFIPTNKSWATYALFAVAVVIGIIVIGKSLGYVGWTTGGWWANNWVSIVTIAVILGIIGAVAAPKKDADTPLTPVQSILSSILSGAVDSPAKPSSE